MKIFKLTALVIFFSIQFSEPIFSQTANNREHISLDKDWKFAFGHPSDTQKDFNTGTAYFSYLAKAGLWRWSSER